MYSVVKPPFTHYISGQRTGLRHGGAVLDSLQRLHGGAGPAQGKNPSTGGGHSGPAGESVRHRPFHRPNKTVHRHPGTDPETAAAVHSEDRGP